MRKLLTNLFVVLMVILFVLPFGVKAAEEQYTIHLTQMFMPTVEEQKEYQGCQYILSDSDGTIYYLGLYDKDKRCYTITGTTIAKEQATMFTVGCNSDELSALVIEGIPSGEYKLTMERATTEYVILRDPIYISIQDNVTINGKTVAVEGTIIDFSVVCNKGYDMPGTCHWCSMISTLERGYDYPFMVAMTVLSILVFIGLWWIGKEAGRTILRVWHCGAVVAICAETLLLYLYKSGVLEGGINFLTAATYYGVPAVLLANLVIASISIVCIHRLRDQMFEEKEVVNNIGDEQNEVEKCNGTEK